MYNRCAILALSVTVLLSGCVVRTYSVTKDRVDQSISEGNRGYLMGRPSSADESQRKVTRSTRVVEVELSSPLKLEKRAKTRIVKEPKIEAQEESLAWENLGGGMPEENLVFEKYTVQKNDTLQKISQKFYGTTKKWMTIYDLNKETLSAPNKVYPGQVLNIPVEALKEPAEKLK